MEATEKTKVKKILLIANQIVTRVIRAATSMKISRYFRFFKGSDSTIIQTV